MNRPIVSILMPAYNASSYLHEALDALFSHGVKEGIELICVDDCSSDNSAEIIESYLPEFKRRHINAMLIKHSKNLGVAAARNTALEHATGEYIYFVDADDKIEADAIAILLDNALKHNADITGCEWWLAFKSSKRHMAQPAASTGDQLFKGFSEGIARWNLWLFLIRRSLINSLNLRFITGANMGEDLMFMSSLARIAKSVRIVHKPLYTYRQINPNAISRTFSEKEINDTTLNIEALKPLYDDDELRLLKLTIKQPLLVSPYIESYDAWRNWWPEANHDIMSNKSFPLRSRLLQIMAAKRQDWYLKLYYHLVFKVVYGVIYK